MRPITFASCGVAFVLLTLLSAAAPQAAASTTVYIPFGNSSQRTDGGIVAGSSYNISVPAGWGYQFDALGFVDVGEDGLSGSYLVGLWDSSAQLVSSAWVGPTSTLADGFRWTNITPVTLGPGTFTIAALLPENPLDAWLDDLDGTILASGLTGAGFGQYASSGVLAFPGTTDSSIYAVANARGQMVMPEPGTAGAMAGLMGLSLVRRRKRAGC